MQSNDFWGNMPFSMIEKIQYNLDELNINDWEYISCNFKLSEDFIRMYKKCVNWNYISRYQKLSESFIEKYQDKIDWVWISEHQNISDIFILKYYENIDVSYLKYNESIQYTLFQSQIGMYLLVL